MKESAAAPPFVLTLDIGSSVVRAVLFDRSGRSVPGMASHRDYEISALADGAAALDVEVLLSSVWECLDRLVNLSQALWPEIRAVAVCTLAGTLLGVDRQGMPVTPLITYADTRSAPQASQLRQRLDEDSVHQRTGCRLHPSYWPAQLLWFASQQPEMFQRVQNWMSLGGYLAWKLFEQRAVSLSEASWTGMLNRHSLDWDQDWLPTVPLREEQLSDLVDLDQPLRGLRPVFALRWPALAQVPWFPAVGDGATANLGSGCYSPERLAITMGSTTALRVVLPQNPDRIPAGLWCYRVDRRRSLLGGALSEGGNVFAWLTRLFSLEASPELDAAVAALPPAESRLTFLPHITGERSPNWAAERRAVIAGLTRATSSLEILRAGMEGVAYRTALVFDLLRAQVGGKVQVIASGGALQSSPAWMGILADVLGVPVQLSSVSESSARGAALLALEALGLIDSLDQVPTPAGQIFEPDLQRHRVYRSAIEQQKRLYDMLTLEGSASHGSL